MEIAQALEFVRHNHRAVLATFRSDGRPQLSPITVGVDGAGLAVISTRENAVKTRNLRRDPRASVCVFPDSFFSSQQPGFVQLDGTVDILSLPDALEPLVDYYRGISGEHPDWDDYRAAMVRDQRCLLRLTVTRAGPDRAG